MKWATKKRVRVKQKLKEFKETRGVESLFLLIFCIILSLYVKDVNAGECKFKQQLTPYQKDIMEIAYRHGEEYDLGLTTVAIAWKESKLGLYNVRYNRSNINDQSFGVLHTVARWKTKNMSPFEAGMWVENMITSPEYSIQEGVKDIIYWQKRAKGDWFKGVGMYNGGNIPNKNYAESITSIVRELKHCEF
ncbi:putative TMhelix containing protein IV [Vibrio phage vB_VpaM_R16F]|nr:putative TMhelix containing protein IV [Vibrio phage vB_VpaM_R16F]